MENLDELDNEILKCIAGGRLNRIPDEFEDSGCTAWLVQEGYANEDSDGLVLTQKGNLALNSTI